MKLSNLLIAILFFTIGHIFTWFQLNGQFIWPWFKNNSVVVAILGIPVSLCFILATKFCVTAFDGVFWPGRFLGFSIGILLYGFLVHMFFHEGINLKTAVSLVLCVGLILIQVLWK